MKYLTIIFCSVSIYTAFAKETCIIPQDIISLIQIHQPYMQKQLITSDYKWPHIKEKFSGANLDGSIISFVNNKNETIWHLNDQKEVTYITFKFNLAKRESSQVEKKIFEKYKNKLTPEEFLKVPSSTRRLTVKDKSGLFELDFFFPVSDYKPPLISSVSIIRKVRDK